MSAYPWQAQTRVLYKTLNPVFNQEFSFEVHRNAEFVVTVFDWDRWSRNDVCGKAVLRLDDHVLSSREKEIELPLDTQGSVLLRLTFYDTSPLWGFPHDALDVLH